MAGIAAGLQAALQLARGRAEAVGPAASAEDDLAAARRSFWAVVPAFICMQLLQWQQTAPAPAPSPGVAMDLIGFTLGWVGFALLSHRIAGRMGRAAQWPRFITLWNWCNLVQYFMLLAASLPGLLGTPDWIGQTAWIAAIGWALWLEWFMTRLALAVPGRVAAALVTLDVAVGLLVAAFTGTG